MLRLFLRNWTWVVPFIVGFVAGKLLVGFLGPAVGALGEFSWLVTAVWPIMFGIFAVVYLTPRLKRFFRE